MSKQPGNYCPARQVDITGISHTIDLRHEPLETTKGYFVWPINPHYCDKRLRACRHCGCLYLEAE